MAQRNNTKSRKGPPRLQRAYFAERLRRLRIARGYPTMRELAAALGMTESAYRRYEKGEAEPDLRAFYTMLAVLDVPASDLIGSYVAWKDPETDQAEASAQHVPGLADARQANYAAPDFVDWVETIDRSIWGLADLYADLLTRTAADRSPRAAAVPQPAPRECFQDAVGGFRRTCTVFDEIKAAPAEAIARIVEQARGNPLPQSKAVLAAATDLRDSLRGL